MKTSTPTPKMPPSPSLKFVVIALVVLLVIGLAIFLMFALTPNKKTAEKFQSPGPLDPSMLKTFIKGDWNGSCEFQNVRVSPKDIILTARCKGKDGKQTTKMVDVSKCADQKVNYTGGELQCWQKM